MPRGDGTGPRGMGQRTGRGLGYCNGYNSPGFTRGYGNGGGFGNGRGFGRMQGRGYGWNNQAYYAPVAPYAGVSEKTILENEIKAMNDQLKALQNRLNEITKTEE